MNWKSLRTFVWVCLVAIPLSLARADEPGGGDQVEWFEPKVGRSEIPGVAEVELIGRTQAGTEIEIDPANVILIQKSNEKLDFGPRILKRKVVSDEKGRFRLPFQMQHGLYQVTVRFASRFDGDRTVLLAMRIDADSVSLNVKVKRPVKIVKVFTSQPQKIGVGLGLAPYRFRETMKPVGQPELDLSATSILSLELEGDLRSFRWWWLADYQYSRFSGLSAVGGFKPADDGFDTHSVGLGGRYRAAGDEHQIWIGSRVEGLLFPLAASDGLTSTKMFDSKLFRLGVDLTYLFKNDAWVTLASIVYRVPFSVSVPEGELTFKSVSDLEFVAGLVWKVGARWEVGAEAKAGVSTFRYDYFNTSAAIANTGEGRLSNTQFMLQARYLFERKSKKP